ncbi:hypothetical protein THTE_1229 [Thermogutta terrifontis]|uniref:Uncharacterized protein n=1 Tax=Thermogutta terrifontis TaxID=1331910 RepID=A0A286RCZ4_9BACT|nr:hypothetical protein THTE_1229 [Thermogutta terrifontis]
MVNPGNNSAKLAAIRFVGHHLLAHVLAAACPRRIRQRFVSDVAATTF